MRTTPIGQPSFSAWQPGDSMFETNRLEAAPPIVVPQRLYEGNGTEDESIFDFVKPEKDDFKGLSKALAFLKFTPDEQEVLFNVIGSTINIVAGVVSIVGAVGAAVDLLNKLGVLGPAEDPVQAALKRIGQRVEQIYGYLAAQDRRGLYGEALDWRVKGDLARNAVMNAKTSRSPENLQALVNNANALNEAILKMLDAGKAKIAFLRSVYGTPWWLPYAQSPYMKTAAGATVNYRDPAQELQAEIWDAGHYLDVLVRSLQDRIAVAMTLEPAFRSTGYDRLVLQQIAGDLMRFAHTWRGAILVADPVFALNAGGTLRSPERDAPAGVPIGAVDPVTGLSSFQPEWAGFTVKFDRTDFPGEAWGGVWDESRATDPAAALAAINAVHGPAVDSVVRACGVDKMLRLSQRFRELASPPLGSDFVKLPNALFRRPPVDLLGGGVLNGNLVSTGEPVTVDLGRLKLFSPHPDRTYSGTRFELRGWKAFRFRMPRRAQQSGIRLGYVLRVGGNDIRLMEFATAADRGGGDFPEATIRQDFDIQHKVYDCYQSAHLSVAQENQFEREGRVNGVERLFLNERDGRAKFRLEVKFVPFAGGDLAAYAGEAEVTIQALEPDTFPDALILSIVVLETRVGLNSVPEEVFADSMTVHLIPKYVVLNPEFFADHHAAVAHLAKTVKEIDRKVIPQHEIVPGPPDPDPAWKVKARALQIERGLDRVQDVITQRNAQGLEIIASNIVPALRM
jgi:hypothetical protein